MDKRKKSLIRGGAVIAVALAAGHLVQTMYADRAGAPVKPGAIEQVSAGAKDKPVAPVTANASLLPGSAALTPASDPAPAVDKVAAADVVVPEPETAAAETVPLTDAATADAELNDGALAADEMLSAVLTEEAAPAQASDDPVLAALTDPNPIVEPATPALPSLAETVPEVTLPETTDPLATADCTPTMQLTAGPQAIISVSIDAPCRAGERVVLRHAGLALAEKLSPEGRLELDLPALRSEGDVSVLFPDAEMLRDAVSLPEVAGLHRFAVQWMADDAFQLHAFENGADYGQPGEVWSDSPVSPNGGFLISLGDPTLDLPMLAEVYTYPATVTADLAIESAVTEATCGRELLGEVLESKDGTVTVTDLTLAMPDCDALGDILVLKNPGQDVTLAAVN